MVQNTALIALIPLFPLLGVLANGIAVWRRKELPKKAVGRIAAGSVLLSALTATFLFVRLIGLEDGGKFHQELFSWIAAGTGSDLLNIPFGFTFDRLSAVMALTVCWVGFLIHVYSIGYMHDDECFGRYFTYLNLFMFAMLLLVLGDNLIVLFIGWEGVGLCSYLLIGFWFEDDAKASAGKKAFIVNRIGDFGFLLGMFFLTWGMGQVGAMSLEFDKLSEAILKLKEIFVVIPGLGAVPLLEVAGVCMFVGATGKSAQIPLYIWLPDAMAGPTPVSALIHAATMVTAGVYMIARMGFMYSLAPFASTVVCLVGGMTALFAATIGIAQNDIKKVLAYSTVSQLGYMFIGVGVGAYSAGVFHLVTHAFFKACLFLGSGAVIMACHHEQDIRRMGGLWTGKWADKKMKWTGLTFILATVCIAGLPPFSGFVSKDEILWMAFSTPNPIYANIHKAVWIMGVLGAFCTAFYMTRLTVLTFFGEYRGADHDHDFHHALPYEKVHEVPKVMWVPLVILMIGFVSLGFMGKSKIFVGTNTFHHWLAPVVDASAHGEKAALPAPAKEGHEVAAIEEKASEHAEAKPVEAGHEAPAAAVGHEVAALAPHGEAEAEAHALHKLELSLMGMSVVVAALGVLFAILVYGIKKVRPPMPSKEGSLGLAHRALLNKYWVDEIYRAIIIEPIRKTSESFLWKIFDVKIVDGSVNGVAAVAKEISAEGLKLQNGIVTSYAFYMVLGVACVLGYLIFG
ncbi:MAG: NADH-quinone oxidoreductase subunit L [Deltaproteobacteria bacterium]|nr:NADH-quinone oxidoreductase subunit L [Deltaproteobacteria bacterium]